MYATVGREPDRLRLSYEPEPPGVPPVLTASLRLGSMLAEHRVEPHYVSGFADLADFLDGLAQDWRGWSLVRRWESLGGTLQLAAQHDGQVRLAVLLRAEYPDDWRAGGTISLEPGEQLRRVASDVRELAEAFSN
ncbi:MAG TPA: DUF6228 family protein [Mycobacteriales bacterium]|nr:DUF6228 family protein [Mycobacteriales bacterium]